MPPRAKVTTLPEELRAELDARLIASGFGDYAGLEAWLAEQGYKIGRSSLHRYGAELEADFERTMADVARTQRLAQAYAESTADEAGAMTSATVRIAQEGLLRITMALREAEEDPARLARLMPNISRALVDLGRLDISRERWARELRAELAADLQKRVSERAGAGPVTPDQLNEVIRAAYGV